MLRHRCCVLTQLLSFPSASSTSQIHRLISAAAPAPSFAVQDYLVASCGLSRAQALKASAKLSHLKSPTKPDAVLSFLAGHGFSSSDVATVVAGDPKRVVKPNVATLRDLGLADCDIAKLCIPNPWLLTTNVESIRAMVSCAESLGVPRGSRIFRHAVSAVAYLSEEKIATKVGYLKKTFRWSDAEVSIAVSKFPILLTRSKDSLQSRSEFLVSEVGLEPAYIAHRPVLLSYSLEGRLRPRYHVVKFLKENELLDCDRDYYSAVMRTEKVFMEKYICPHMEAAPHLAEDYAEACRGEVPTRFRFA
ncbi:hypothetical protein CFC21_004253 [Triticum aestivum]|uniref:Uncharacterized protein n=2 Tax=Triticum TaxID=4564 RepID=A0A9R0QJE5_TRITD|nr:hypothetical protein CFC21_004253 [Triticum aestivum]VAH11150.1 unnamed protein product [Triticum turgidum subsp. durum]